ncbi:FAD-dependent oxidoreductase [Dokdonella sp.]|uniref:FAD-dependent oxidoreductase n=1 Tax=Dokdonella sp. TaxID=2291710 RepID=UPI0031BF5210|nr:FAD-dependent oxidoreductase [Dokdonella sp.]
MQATDVRNPEYFHKVVDCQWACPAHTRVPEYIRLIAAGRHDDAYLLNWDSNVFPGILGRVCDRPCEPACRRGRVEENNRAKPEPVAICRLKRVAADHRKPGIETRMRERLPAAVPGAQLRRVACIGAGPSSLTLARDLAPLGYQVTVFEADPKGGGFMRTQVPRFRLPESVIDEEVGYILDLGARLVANTRIESMRTLLAQGFDAIFVGCGAPRGRDLQLPGRDAAAAQIHVGIDWLASVYFGHVKQVGKRVIVLGGGNTAMDCCRSARRLGGEDVKVIVRSGYAEMKASPWEKEDAEHEGIEILNWLNPRAFVHEGGKLTGMLFTPMRAEQVEGRRRLLPTGEPDRLVACDEVLIAVGQENAFPWIERDLGIEFDEWGLPRLDPTSLQSTLPQVFFGGDAAFGPKNIIWSVEHGHQAAISIHNLLQGVAVGERPPPLTNLVSQKMGIHEWTYDNEISPDDRHVVPWAPKEKTLADISHEVELGFDLEAAWKEAQRCLNCDVQTVFTKDACIECDACVDVCPMDCITFTENGEEEELRTRLSAPALNLEQALYVSAPLKTGRIMAKDEDVCLHCSLCAERCPTGAWDMQRFLYAESHAGQHADGSGHPRVRGARK